ncbi:CASC3/Barentsz eIF4AIII binding-domain-containing protein [Plectosphaerella plurivora]|uniref:CASC3/Barentsz eIF4AIII binding-domain-containing protein n=1 Tax=Plectosphaerella plurivora TaxID=936078 RepID=A0A9P8VJZ3_9PEZI|nr:CASC3/Barentsz eIF4AIII binding-domain-containing protein [Plectosphaerella plurivora]
MAALRRRKMIGRKRTVEDEEGGPEQLDLDDDSLSEGTIGTDDNDHDADSDTSNLDDASPVGPQNRKPKSTGNGAPKHPAPPKPASTPQANPSIEKPSTDTQAKMAAPPAKEEPADGSASTATEDKATPKGPLVVSSNSANKLAAEPLGDRRRKEHEDYKRKKAEDPAFVPNRGAFFMHDHRHPGPAANGFRPFGRGRGRGGRGGGIGGPYAPFNQYHGPPDPLTSGQWAHDMHEAVADPMPPRPSRHMPEDEGLPNGTGHIPTCPPNATPINRTMSTEKQLGKVQVRVYLPVIGKGPVVAGVMTVKQYTKLPDHRPPLRRDKPVRISLPRNPPKYIFPAVDRSFIFIPRAMRPNQQRARGKPRSGLGSIGGYSRRTSVFGGSFYGSAYSPSIALSRRSSIAPNDGRDYLFSPTGSVVSRAPMPMDNPRPVVRLPPSVQQAMPMQHMQQMTPQMVPEMMGGMEMPVQQYDGQANDFSAPNMNPAAQRPVYQENRAPPPIMHQPRPQKTVSVAGIETPSLNQQSFDTAFHQQVPVQVSNGLGEGHARRPSYATQRSAGTPASQIPERAIHAAPFQPSPYQQPQQLQPPQQAQGYYSQAYGMMPQPQQGYYYPPQYNGGSMGPPASTAPFVPASQHQAQGYPPQPQGDQYGQQQSVLQQEVNGMVYYYDASQMDPMNSYQQGYQQPPQGYGAGVPGMAGMVTPSPDGLYYAQQAPGMVYYPQ